jgi:antitoxin ParD1/3/4
MADTGKHCKNELVVLMEEQDRFREVRLNMLRQDVQKGLESGAGEAWDPEAMKRQARSRRSSAKERTKASEGK